MQSWIPLVPDSASTFSWQVDALYFYLSGVTLFFALLIRYLSEERGLRLSYGRPSLARGLVSGVVVLGFFWMQACVLLLAYRGWWDRLILYPGG